jgi:hypothetical protein
MVLALAISQASQSGRSIAALVAIWLLEKRRPAVVFVKI